MPLKIIDYPHPTLRHVSKPLKRVDEELRSMIDEMFELMYDAKGIGLAANQVDLPYRFFILNCSGDKDIKEEEQVFINPVITNKKGSKEAEEGCLSIGGVFKEVKRPEKITINAYTLQGQEVKADIDGLFARAFQHETDHLDGVLFIDRLSDTAKLSIRDQLEEFELVYQGKRESGEIGTDEELKQRLIDLENLRT